MGDGMGDGSLLGLAREIAMRWVTAKQGCTGEQAHAMRCAAEATSAGFVQAGKDLAAAAKAQAADPKGKAADASAREPTSRRLSELLSKKVEQAESCIGAVVEDAVKALAPG